MVDVAKVQVPELVAKTTGELQRALLNRELITKKVIATHKLRVGDIINIELKPTVGVSPYSKMILVVSNTFPGAAKKPSYARIFLEDGSEISPYRTPIVGGRANSKRIASE